MPTLHLFNIILSSLAAGNVGEIIKKGAGVYEVPVNGTLREECGITCFFIPLLWLIIFSWHETYLESFMSICNSKDTNAPPSRSHQISNTALLVLEHVLLLLIASSSYGSSVLAIILLFYSSSFSSLLQRNFLFLCTIFLGCKRTTFVLLLLLDPIRIRRHSRRRLPLGKGRIKIVRIATTPPYPCLYR